MRESSEVVMAVLSPVTNELIQYGMARMPLMIPAFWRSAHFSVAIGSTSYCHSHKALRQTQRTSRRRWQAMPLQAHPRVFSKQNPSWLLSIKLSTVEMRVPANKNEILKSIEQKHLSRSRGSVLCELTPWSLSLLQSCGAPQATPCHPRLQESWSVRGHVRLCECQCLRFGVLSQAGS
jgi:hypothetical protein